MWGMRGWGVCALFGGLCVGDAEGHRSMGFRGLG